MKTEKKLLVGFFVFLLFIGCSQRIGPTAPEEKEQATAKGVRNAIVACEISSLNDTTAEAVVSLEGLADSINVRAVCQGLSFSSFSGGIIVPSVKGDTLIFQGTVPPKVFRQTISRFLIRIKTNEAGGEIIFLPQPEVYYNGEVVSPLMVDGEI